MLEIDRLKLLEELPLIVYMILISNIVIIILQIIQIHVINNLNKDKK